MAVSEYVWQAATHDSVRSCVKWCLNQFNLRDWQVDVVTGDDPPPQIKDEKKVQGKVVVWDNQLKALIWIPLARQKKENHNVYETVIHEMLHVLVLGLSPASKQVSELVSYRLEAPLYRLFCKDTKRQVSDERPQIE